MWSQNFLCGLNICCCSWKWLNLEIPIKCSQNDFYSGVRLHITTIFITLLSDTLWPDRPLLDIHSLSCWSETSMCLLRSSLQRCRACSLAQVTLPQSMFLTGSDAAPSFYAICQAKPLTLDQNSVVHSAQPGCPSWGKEQVLYKLKQFLKAFPVCHWFYYLITHPMMWHKRLRCEMERRKKSLQRSSRDIPHLICL